MVACGQWCQCPLHWQFMSKLAHAYGVRHCITAQLLLSNKLSKVKLLR